MKGMDRLPDDVRRSVSSKKALLWLNDNWKPAGSAFSRQALQLGDVYEAERRWEHFAPLLEELFPELAASHGIIESSLQPADTLHKAYAEGRDPQGRWLIKCDHSLPVAGSIKARGGIYEVLLHAERLAATHGIFSPEENSTALASPAARTLFSRHRVSVGSTGNLGLSIGIIATALGFRATVHMSSDAKEWKKERLRARGVEVIEHAGDFEAAVAAGRTAAAGKREVYFVDDENSVHLFLGYSVAALRLVNQLSKIGIRIDAQHPLFVYLPCGVGGAPGGITFGLRHLFGDQVHCFLAEPVAFPSMLIRLASAEDRPISVRDLGLHERTDADGLAVGQASEFAAGLMRPLVSGAFTVPDKELLEGLYAMHQSEGLRVEPSAAAGLPGPRWLLESEAGQRYQALHGLAQHMREAVHVIWTTGGLFVPDEEYRVFLERGSPAQTTLIR